MYGYKTAADEILANLMKESRSAYEQVVCHPDSESAKTVEMKFTNLVNTGIMLEIDRQLLACFSMHNGYSVIPHIVSIDEMKEDIAPFYKLIEV